MEREPFQQQRQGDQKTQYKQQQQQQEEDMKQEEEEEATASAAATSSTTTTSSITTTTRSSSSSTLQPLDLLDPEIQPDPDLQFMLLLAQLQQWQQRYGTTVVPPRVYDKPELARWAQDLRQWYRQRPLGVQQQQQLEEEEWKYGEMKSQGVQTQGSSTVPQQQNLGTGLVAASDPSLHYQQQQAPQEEERERRQQQWREEDQQQQHQATQNKEEEQQGEKQQVLQNHHQQQQKEHDEPVKALVVMREPVVQGTLEGEALVDGGERGGAISLSAWQLQELQESGFSWNPSEVGGGFGIR
jgi:hypothetical protein